MNDLTGALRHGNREGDGLKRALIFYALGALTLLVFLNVGIAYKQAIDRDREDRVLLERTQTNCRLQNDLRAELWVRGQRVTVDTLRESLPIFDCSKPRRDIPINSPLPFVCSYADKTGRHPTFCQ